MIVIFSDVWLCSMVPFWISTNMRSNCIVALTGTIKTEYEHRQMVTFADKHLCFCLTWYMAYRNWNQTVNWHCKINKGHSLWILKVGLVILLILLVIGTRLVVTSNANYGSSYQAVQSVGLRLWRHGSESSVERYFWIVRIYSADDLK